jgi:DNA (cytosine-5)-methyltransferase 1
MIPVIDLFAGPGGLGEGFSAFRAAGKKRFRVVLSIEKNSWARETLRLRSFFRQFPSAVPDDYYQLLRGQITLDELYLRYPKEASQADEEAWLAELGNPEKNSSSEIDERIQKALDGSSNWVLIGGPPCQAYSLVGRSRMAREPEKLEKDPRHFLYKEYLRILAVHRPPVFVMENVKGILSSKVEGSLIIDRILADLREPCESYGFQAESKPRKKAAYDLFPFAHYGNSPFTGSLFEELESNPSGYIICAEKHGIPQARHRLILLGIRSDLKTPPTALPVTTKCISMWKAIQDLPKLRSKLSKEEDSGEDWISAIKQVGDVKGLSPDGIDLDVWEILKKLRRQLNSALTPGGEFIFGDVDPVWQHAWFHDSRLRGACNHSTRGHIASDLWRYFYAACFAKVRHRSPLLTDFPVHLLPKHKNATHVHDDDEVDFADRFRVQVKSRPSTTVTAHIAKDGHYFIHPDPLQCRSLTVREAARLQTFPDNYFFLGPRTSQYQQVGNAVPPLLAKQLANVVHRLVPRSAT